MPYDLGRIVRHCVAKGCRIEELSLKKLKGFSKKIDEDVYDFLSTESVVNRRRAFGGTARSNVMRRLKELRA
jgi:argininosuccinate lyase